MANDNSQSSHYVITAKAQRGVLQQTRVMAASAVVLARSWREAGYDDVQVVDPQGNLLIPEGYATKVLNGCRPYP